jgi:hypothetical protein
MVHCLHNAIRDCHYRRLVCIRSYCRVGLLLEELERALLRLVPGLHEVLQRLASEGVLLPGNNPALLRAHEILLLESSGGVVRSAVPYLQLRADRGDFVRLTSGTRSHFLMNNYIFCSS